jgi:hypothetical protein
VATRAAKQSECQAQVAILRDIFANPFLPPPAIASAWPAWNDGTIKRLATAAYENRSLPGGTLDNALMAVLGDALEEAGCRDPDVLRHCRGPAVHVRGCWLLDALLGKG